MSRDFDSEVDHGLEEFPEGVEAAWSDEIARRTADIDSGCVKTIPSDIAEEMIRGIRWPADEQSK